MVDASHDATVDEPSSEAQLAALDRYDTARRVLDRLAAGAVPADRMVDATEYTRDHLTAALDELHRGISRVVAIDVPQREVAIHWLIDVDQFDYVRQQVRLVRRRRGRPGASWVPGRIVGWADLTEDAPSYSPGLFARRVFWIADHDRHSVPTGVYRTGGPFEAVDPRTVAPGVPGLWTARAAGRR